MIPSVTHFSDVAHMPGSTGEAVLEEEQQLVWQDIQQSKRSGMAVMYLHVPFCANHCLFCGFYRNKWHEEHSAPYADALIKELELEASSLASQSAPINAVYFGGGTPTALHAQDLARVIRRIRELYPLSADCEITVEGRIFHFDDDKIDACLDAGANRFSTGVQSFNTKVRKRQGRKASGPEAIRFFEGLRDRNRAAIVYDLILGLPYQTEEVWHDDLQTVVDLGLDGVDLFTLAVFPGSPLSKAIDKGACDPAAPLPQQGTMYGEGLEYMHRQGLETDLFRSLGPTDPRAQSIQYIDQVRCGLFGIRLRSRWQHQWIFLWHPWRNRGLHAVHGGGGKAIVAFAQNRPIVFSPQFPGRRN